MIAANRNTRSKMVDIIILVRVSEFNRDTISATLNGGPQAAREICTITDININKGKFRTGDSQGMQIRGGTDINSSTCDRTIAIMDRNNNGNTITARIKRSSD
jgi:hypothetical protein